MFLFVFIFMVYLQWYCENYFKMHTSQLHFFLSSVMCFTEGQINQILKGLAGATCPRPKLLSFGKKMKRRPLSRKALSVHGSVRRSRSIQIDPENIQGSYCNSDWKW